VRHDVGSRPAVHGDVERTAAIYAAVIDEANEHYKPEWIVAGICQQANEIKMGDCAPMGPELQVALRRDLGKPYTFISDPEQKQGDIFKGKGGVIHWVGPIDGSDDRVTVPTSYYCGGCAPAARWPSWRIETEPGPSPAPRGAAGSHSPDLQGVSLDP
jgi:hypothetical protein